MASLAQPIADFLGAVTRRAPGALTIGVDVGTTTVKAGVFDAKGNALASYADTYAKSFPQDGWVEQNPADWTKRIGDAFSIFDKKIGLRKVNSLCVCSQVNTHVFVDAECRPLMPAIVWSDTRAKQEAVEIDQALNDDDKSRLWGFGYTPDASFALSRAMWVAKNRPDIWSQTKWIMSPKDYCNFWLSGQASSDIYSSVGLIGPTNEYILELDQWLPGFTNKLPPISPMQHALGHASLENTPSLDAIICTGTMDAWGNFIGSGVIQPGLGALITGTSSIIGVMSKQIGSPQGVITFPPFEGGHLHAGPTQSGSDALVWFAKNAGRSLDEILSAIKTRSINAKSPIFLPHLQGERAPIWDPNARGVFLGLNYNHDLIDMALAVIEGVAFSERQLFEACRDAAGVSPHALRLSGGSSRNDYWSQLRADILGVRLDRMKTRESGVLGAAAIAGVAGDAFDDFHDAAANLVDVEIQFSPRRDRKELIDRRYKTYRESYHRLKPIFDSMADANSV